MPLSLQYGPPAEKVESEKEISNSFDWSSDPIKLCHIDFFPLLSISHRYFLSSLSSTSFFSTYRVKQTVLLSESRKVREILEFCNFFFFFFPPPFFHLTSRFDQSLDRPFVLSRDFPRPCTIDQYPYSLCVLYFFPPPLSLSPFFEELKLFHFFQKMPARVFPAISYFLSSTSLPSARHGIFYFQFARVSGLKIVDLFYNKREKGEEERISPHRMSPPNPPSSDRFFHVLGDFVYPSSKFLTRRRKDSRRDRLDKYAAKAAKIESSIFIAKLYESRRTKL